MRREQATPSAMTEPFVYDKAKYHSESVEQLGLREEQAYVHTAMFLGWLMDHDLMSDEFMDNSGSQVAAFKERRMTPIKIYDLWDGCLIDDMLSDRGNAFARAYFEFDSGAYLQDFGELLVGKLPSEFHVPFTWDNYALMAARIDERFETWLGDVGESPTSPTPSPARPRRKRSWWRRLFGR